MNRFPAVTLDPSIQSEAFHRVMVDLASDFDDDHDAPGVSVAGAVRLAELAATYLAVSVALRGRAARSRGSDPMEVTRRIWMSYGWSVGADDPITDVVEELARRAASRS